MAINSPEELAVGLYERGSIGFAITDDPEMIGKPGGFIKLKSGRLSPTYVNIRGITSFNSNHPKMTIREQVGLRENVVEAYSELLDSTELPYNHLLGIPHAMTCLSGLIAQRRWDSVLSMRSGEKDYGAHKTIEGDYTPGDVVVAADDVVTDGASKLETVGVIRAKGLTLNEFIVLVDREEGGREALSEKQLGLSAALGMGAITSILAQEKLINDRQISWTVQYFQDLVDKGTIVKLPAHISELTA